MDYFKLILIFGLMWLVQIAFTMKQQKHIRSTLSVTKNSYSSGYLGTGITRSKFNFGPGVLLIIVMNNDDTVVEFKVLKGFSVFSRFKSLNKFKNKHFSFIEFKKNEKKIQEAYLQAIDQINLAKQAT